MKRSESLIPLSPNCKINNIIRFRLLRLEIMNKILFKNRSEFRDWLKLNALSDDGICLIFNKNKKTETIREN
jgi:hypothetical protein